MSTTFQGDDSFVDFAGDRTQPSAEILNTLSMNSPIKPEPQDPQVPPPSEYDALNAQLLQNPHQPESWRRLVNVAEATGEISKITATYDALLKQYPNTASAQIQYISHFLNTESTSDKAHDLFKKFLKTSPCVELWTFYLNHVRRNNVGNAQRDDVRKSYEFTLNHIGQDKDSGDIWSDYIQFLQSGEATTTWEEQQKMDALRKVYHRAVQIPLDNVERLWQDLEAFETNLNRITAKKFMADLSPAHMQARTVLRQLVNHVGAIYPPTTPDIFLPSLPKFDASERALVGKWKAYLKWEESNPLEIEEKDRTVLITRIQGVYRKAVIRMRYYTEIWFMAYTWTNSVGKHDEAMSILKAGMEANPSSFLLTFAYAEAQELKKEFADVHSTYDKFLTLLRSQLETFEQTIATANGSFSSTNGPSTGSGNDVVNNTSVTTEAGIHSTNSSFNTQTSDEKPSKHSELQRLRTEYGVAWIMYMRFGRRAEGVKSLRGIFGKARRDRWIPWEVYEASALMEYHCSDDRAVASRIFEKGLDYFGEEIDYVLRYLSFLISINDENNARALFERVIPNFSPDRARPLWERWARYEYQYGDLEAALKLEKRMAEVYASDPPIKRFAQRHMYLGIDAIADRDLGFALARKGTATNPLGKSETQQSLISSGTLQGTKRMASPDYRNKREDNRGVGGGGGGSGSSGGNGGDYGQGNKRMRPSSPPPPPPPRGGDRDRETRWEGPSSRRRPFSSPPPTSAWDREDRSRAREGPPSRAQDREEKPRQVSIPPVISWFVGDLPAASSFDGPVFRTDDLLNLFRNAVIPSMTTRTKSPPPTSRSGQSSSLSSQYRTRGSFTKGGGGGGRPPPDYGPYQGPSGRGGRRY